jgi:nitrogen fixation/metabolism regulation signal transduction histidine kinase
MSWRTPKPLIVFMHGASLRRRVAYSLALVRLILVPVILLAVYYLFAMGWIVDRIVSVDAPLITYAERASIQMLDARRAEQNYFLLHDPADVQANRQALAQLEQTIERCRQLQPAEKPAISAMQTQLQLYRQSFEQVVARAGEIKQPPLERLRRVVRAYQQDLDELLRNAGRQSRSRLIEDLRTRIGSFDAEMAATMESENPTFHAATLEMRSSSQQIINLANGMEARSWKRVQDDHRDARDLIYRAEWVLGIVSALTILLSIWVSLILPRQVVKPLTDLKSAVDHAAAGNYEIEFEVQGEGEVVQLANSVRNLIAHLREKHVNWGPTAKP